ncbi:MAG: phospholipase [Candidatus Midichloriaceae bacterium]|jgi:phospholipase/carboxylesterase|nr:phospholipase [Candidatus Midichloriaceae bacterium]
MKELTFTSYSANPKIKPKNLVVLIHGYGSNAKDLISIAPDLADSLEDAIFVSPNAPFRFEGGLPNAYQWYSLLDRSIEPMLEGYANAKPILHKFIEDRIYEYSLSFADVTLIGFSQGGMMTLHYGSESEQKLKGIISFSGYILDDGTFGSKVKSKPNTLVCHGDLDMVVPFESYQYALKKMQQLKLPIAGYVAKGLGHGIDYGCINAAKSFLENINS